MKRKVYRIIHYGEKYKIRAKWDIYAANDQEAQEKAEHLRNCCINAGWTPIETEIKVI